MIEEIDSAVRELIHKSLYSCIHELTMYSMVLIILLKRIHFVILKLQWRRTFTSASIKV